MATPKRNPGDPERTQIWYSLVVENFIQTGTIKEKMGPRRFGKELGGVAEKRKLPWKEIRGHLGTPEAWRSWKDGSRTPEKETRTAVDLLLLHLEGRPAGWVISGPGEMRLSPVWGWPTSLAGLPEHARRPAEVIAAQFWQQVAELDIRSFLHIVYCAAELGGLPPKRNAWPPLLLLPVAVSNILPREEEGELPHLKISPPSGEGGVAGWVRSMPSQLAKEFAEWSLSRGRYLPGEVWLRRLRELPGQPFYEEGEVVSAAFGFGCAAIEKQELIEAARHVLVAAFATENDGK